MSSLTSNILIRPVDTKDTEELVSWFNQLVDEDPGIVENFHVTQEQERHYLSSLLKEIKQREALSLVVIKEGKIVAKVDVKKLKREVDRHIGEVSFGVLRGFGACGGELLRELPKFSGKINCHVLIYYILSSNKFFIDIFKKANYKVCGQIENFYRKDGSYFDRKILVNNLK
ncbi:GNAT family N-acetyltransferase [Nitrospira defluvii]|nr:GNAT family N-acetyltransferase [Nitrospira defluvii]